jgi:hypothetical protein
MSVRKAPDIAIVQDKVRDALAVYWRDAPVGPSPEDIVIDVVSAHYVSRIEELERCCAAHQEDVDGWVDEQARLIGERDAAEAKVEANPLDQLSVMRHRAEAVRQDTERLWGEAERLAAVSDRLRAENAALKANIQSALDACDEYENEDGSVEPEDGWRLLRDVQFALKKESASV